jgi:DHA2 family multidrug resistance protein
MLQGLMGYPVFSAGLLLAPRGIGTILAMVFVGRLLQRVDARYLLVFGLVVSSYSFWWMSSFALNLPQWDVAMSGVIQGFGLGFVWVPLTTIAYSTLAPEARNEAAGVFNLMRNIGSSVGISTTVALLAQNTQRLHSALAANITATNPLLLDPTVQRYWNPATSQGVAAINAEVTRQAAMIAYIDDFKLMMLMALALIPLVLLFSAPSKVAAGHAAMAME